MIIFLVAPRIAFSFPNGPLEQAHVPASIDSSAVVTAWVEANLATLPTTRAGFLPLPQNYHGPILEQLSAEQKTAIWQDKISQVLSSRTWRLEQSELIVEFYQATTADVFRTPIEHPENMPGLEAWAVDWAQRASQVIGVDDVRHISMDLYNLPPEISQVVGPEVAVPDYGTAVVDGLYGASNSTAPGGTSSQPRCNCHGLGWFSCLVGQTCLGDPCNSNPTGCGPWGIMSCRGVCGYIHGGTQPAPTDPE